MIKVIIKRTAYGDIKAFKVTGHANYGKHGHDVVCSAVSVLTQTAVIGLDLVAKAKFDYKISEGYLWCDILDSETETQKIKSSAILETMYEGLKNIKEGYGKYITIVEEEV